MLFFCIGLKIVHHFQKEWESEKKDRKVRIHFFFSTLLSESVFHFFMKQERLLFEDFNVDLYSLFWVC